MRIGISRHNALALAILVTLLAIANRGCLDPCANCTSAVVTTGPGSFSFTGPLHEDRGFAESQPVPGNADQVLIAGGGRFVGYLARSQIFDPSTNPHTITDDAELTDARAHHTATLLKDGTVLVTGGDNGAIALQTAELYQPSTTAGTPGTFKSTGTMFAPRTHHTATLLDDGEVLIAGGSPGLEQVSAPGGGTEPIPNGANNSAEIYDPASQAFIGARQAMTTARTEHTATLLEDGRVLLVGGVDNTGTVLASAEIFDPRSQTFTPTAGNLNFARFDHQATLIECGKGCSLDGEVLITGGFDATFATDGNTQNAELFDPTSQKFSDIGLMMISGRALHTAIALSDGSVLIAGGIDGDSQHGYVNLSSAELFSITSSSSEFVAISSTMSNVRSGLMAASYDSGSAILLGFGGRADVHGDFPETTSGPPGTFATTDSFNPSNMSFTSDASSPMSCPVTATGNDSQGCAITRAAYTATTLSNGTILFVGGFDATAPSFPNAEVYSFSQGAFVSTANNMSESRVFGEAAQFSSSSPATSGILIAGGLPACDGTADLYNPASNPAMSSFTKSSGSMVATSSSTFRCELFTATTLTNGEVLLTGGLDSASNVLNTAEIYNPATDTFTATGNMNAARWGHSAVLLNDGSGEVLILGGDGCNGASASSCTESSAVFLENAELYNPTSGTFSLLSTTLNSARFVGTATNLNPVGSTDTHPQVLIAGGSGDNSSLVYDAVTQTFMDGAPMNSIRFFQQATPLGDADGLILISGGAGQLAFGVSGTLTAINTAEIYVPSGVGSFCATGDMRSARAYHAAAASMAGPNQRVLVAGGVGENTDLGSAELYEPPLETAPCGAGAAPVTLPSSPENARRLMKRYMHQLAPAD